MKYKTKLLLGFGTLLVVMIILLGTIFNVLTKLNDNMNEIVLDRYEKLKAVSDMQSQVNNLSRLLAGIVLDEKWETIQADKLQIEKSIGEASATMAFLQQRIQFDKARELLAQVAIRYEKYVQLSRDVIEKVEAGEKAEAVLIVGRDLNMQKDALFLSLEEIQEFQESLLDEAYDRSLEEYAYTKSLTLYFIFFCILVGVAVTLWVIHGISQKLTGITSIISTVVSRSAEKFPRIPVTSQDEIGDIGKAFNKMAATLEEHSRQEKEYNRAMQEH
ncbi:MCP four helix bundle domain-containing protein [Brevibacillus composti]|uniref:MCP four helix bundle domain-containing protein n=1 Tax=Brevibacillus composti TaxID=2796470 RepID=A0A7T5JP40_9BACL|nr:MCP four helix bundle domain-containing protein [Brevibacillus composti]QQE75088.1 MCP four helix bundle domain-containing protein [Brevibacillus composti]QUO42174.1 MCP four helix bundle domain-containing protein [Brevibacillus composti]